MRDLGRLLILFGAILLVAGVLLTFAGKLGLGKLPGDIVYRRGNFSFYFPLMTSIVLSIVLSLILWLVNHRQ
jgi:formate hydrogenlyase subunit 3/multisubunit Na+/H+ antiporter MnhD subunit